MLFIDEILNIAYGLAVLTYFFGVLIYSLPVPLRSLKRWGSILIYDGLFSALLILLFNFIIYLVEYIRSLFGVEASKLFTYLYGLEDSMLSFFLFIKFVSSVLTTEGLLVFVSVFSPFSGLLSFAISTVALSLIISSIVLNNTGLFIALGMAFYAMPFRVGRSAGASLIAFTVVSSIAFPLLPQWISLFTNTSNFPQPEVPKGIAYLSGHVYGDKGHPKTSIIYFTEINGGKTYRFIVKEGGYYSAGRPDKGLPANKTYRVRVVFLGQELPTNIDEIRIPQDLKRQYADPHADYKLDIKVAGFFVKDSILVSANGCEQYTIRYINSTHYVVYCRSPSQSAIIKSIYQQTCKPEPKAATNVSSIRVKIVEYTWKDVNCVEERDEVIGNSSSFAIIYGVSKCEVDYPNVSESHYTRELITSFTALIIASFWMWIAITIAILSFFTLITLFTYGVAWALGAWRPRVPFPLP